MVSFLLLVVLAFQQALALVEELELVPVAELGQALALALVLELVLALVLERYIEIAYMGLDMGQRPPSGCLGTHEIRRGLVPALPGQGGLRPRGPPESRRLVERLADDGQEGGAGEDLHEAESIELSGGEPSGKRRVQRARDGQAVAVARQLQREIRRAHGLRHIPHLHP